MITIEEAKKKYYEEYYLPHIRAVRQAGREMLKHQYLWDDVMEAAFDEDVRIAFLKQLREHDKSKLTDIELVGYTRKFILRRDPCNQFERAWHHHKVMNPHHPEHWYNVSKDGIVSCIEMEYSYILEMIADWIGAGKIYSSDIKHWVKPNINKFLFGRDTATIVGSCIERIVFPNKDIDIKIKHVNLSPLANLEQKPNTYRIFVK